MSEPLYRGSCLCGGVRYEVSAPVEMVSHCHCSMCRKAHGAAFGTYAGVRSEAHVVTAGAELMREYRSSGHVTRVFCSVCGSPLLWRSEGMDGWVAFPLATLDTPLVPARQKHIHVESRALWYEISDHWPQRPD